MMDDLQKKIASLCAFLPPHVDVWTRELQLLKSPIRALGNFCEQLKCCDVNLEYIETFDEISRQLKERIFENMEEELQLIKASFDKLSKSNHELKNKLTTLERATIDLDWDLDLPPLKGSPIQPPLDTILQMSYQFWLYFLDLGKNICNALKNLRYSDEGSVKKLEEAVKVDLTDNRDVFMLLALTHYVNNKM